MNYNSMQYQDLYRELSEYEQEGIGLFLGDVCASPLRIVDACAVHEEEAPYMRDYIFSEEGEVEEIHFDRFDQIIGG